MPMLTIEMGTPLYRPVIVVNPRSEVRVNGGGDGSRYEAMACALEGVPSVI